MGELENYTCVADNAKLEVSMCRWKLEAGSWMVEERERSGGSWKLEAGSGKLKVRTRKHQKL